MKEIRLGGKKGYSATVDDSDYEWLTQRKWGVCNGGPYAHQTGRPDIMMHREVLGLTKGDGLQADHRNGNTLDNRKINLRRSTRAENMRNGKTPRCNSTGYKGVYLNRSRYRAGIKVNNRTHHLGSLRSALSAALAYDEAAKRLHGEFARLNFPD